VSLNSSQSILADESGARMLVHLFSIQLFSVSYSEHYVALNTSCILHICSLFSSCLLYASL